MKIYPDVVSNFNLIMGFFQKAFAIATFEAQARIPKAIVEQHQLPGKAGGKLEVAPLSSLVLVQNFILTYFADYLPVDALLDQLRGARADPAAGGGGTGGGGTGTGGGTGGGGGAGGGGGRVQEQEAVRAALLAQRSRATVTCWPTSSARTRRARCWSTSPRKCTTRPVPANPRT